MSFKSSAARLACCRATRRSSCRTNRGVHYSKYEYDGLYTSDDFHHTPADCPTTGDILDFNDYLQVTKCDWSR